MSYYDYGRPGWLEKANAERLELIAERDEARKLAEEWRERAIDTHETFSDCDSFDWGIPTVLPWEEK